MGGNANQPLSFIHNAQYGTIAAQSACRQPHHHRSPSGASFSFPLLALPLDSPPPAVPPLCSLLPLGLPERPSAPSDSPEEPLLPEAVPLLAVLLLPLLLALLLLNASVVLLVSTLPAIICGDGDHCSTSSMMFTTCLRYLQGGRKRGGGRGGGEGENTVGCTPGDTSMSAYGMPRLLMHWLFH